MTAEAAPDLEILEQIGPFLVRLSTGEIVEDLRDRDFAEPPKDRWEPRSLDDVEAVLGWLDREKVEATALRRRAANLEAQADRHERRAAWMRGRFAAAVEAVVRANLPTGRKSWDSREGYGRCGLRLSRGRRIVGDVAAAVAWAEVHAPAAVKRDVSILVSRLPDGDVPGVEMEEPQERFFWADGK